MLVLYTQFEYPICKDSWPYAKLTDRQTSLNQYVSSTSSKLKLGGRGRGEGAGGGEGIISKSGMLSIWAMTWENRQNGCVPSKDSGQSGYPPSLRWAHIPFCCFYHEAAHFKLENLRKDSESICIAQSRYSYVNERTKPNFIDFKLLEIRISREASDDNLNAIKENTSGMEKKWNFNCWV